MELPSEEQIRLIKKATLLLEPQLVLQVPPKSGNLAAKPESKPIDRQLPMHIKIGWLYFLCRGLAMILLMRSGNDFLFIEGDALLTGMFSAYLQTVVTPPSDTLKRILDANPSMSDEPVTKKRTPRCKGRKRGLPVSEVKKELHFGEKLSSGRPWLYYNNYNPNMDGDDMPHCLDLLFRLTKEMKFFDKELVIAAYIFGNNLDLEMLLAFSERAKGQKFSKNASDQEMLEIVMSRYEKEIRHPIQNFIGGKLAEALLIQLHIQKLKLDIETAMLELDQILRANEINFAILAALPAFILSLLLIMEQRRQISGSAASAASDDEGRNGARSRLSARSETVRDIGAKRAMMSLSATPETVRETRAERGRELGRENTQ
ncbi:hypothetical protein Ahy_B06g084822 isoform C [Arachis hypogaea]|uniref:Uncharacterized protein n=1 Tax=Arachis hypogaea TaxID=3818 RepID=A0A444YSV2_ARAHY|nr:hypothetical protein Ahy_B06g084822 isoform C [Arachis hypogaea]